MHHINLASGSSYFESPDTATTAAIESLQRGGANTYGPVEGSELLRKAISARYEPLQAVIRPEQVMITPGSKSGIHTILSVLLQEGDEVLIPTPAWFGFHELVKYSRGKLVTFQTQLEDGYAINPEALRKALNAKTRVLLLTNPGNPTGRIYTRAELETIFDIAADFPNLYIISDEIYDFITYSRAFTPALCCKGQKERLLIVNGFSKSFAMSGWRIGYVTGPEEVIRKFVAFQAGTLSGVSPFIQAAALATLENQEQALQPIMEELTRNRELVSKALDGMAHVSYYKPDGAYYYFPDFSYYLGSHTSTGNIINSSTELCQFINQQYGIEMLSGDYFGAPGHARMSFAVAQHNLQQAMERLQIALASLNT